MPRRGRVARCLGVLLLAVAGLGPVATAAAPAPPATKLYVGHAARLTAQIPSGWAVDPALPFDYVGTDGFVASMPVTGATLDDACSDFAVGRWFDRATSVAAVTWSGAPACRMDGATLGIDAAALVVPHPRPFDAGEERFSYAAILTAPDDLDAIAATIDFSPDRMTPEAYLTAVIDIVEARAYWADALDWPEVRRDALALVTDYPSIEIVYGEIQSILARLEAAGDNHHGFLLPDQPDPVDDGFGFGMALGGNRVLAVYPDGPAARAGIRPGDVVEAADGRPLPTAPGPIDPAGLLAAGTADPTLPTELTLLRAGRAERVEDRLVPEPYDRYRPPTGRRLAGGIGYVEVPHVSDWSRDADFAAEGQRIVAAADDPAACGWVVDLRLNGGGSYSPMVTTLGPILGNGRFFGLRTAEGRQSWVSYEDGRIAEDGREISDYLGELTYELTGPNPPVAVLTGPMTGSAGEVATLAFVERPNARLFGETTAGLTTGVGGSWLFDGAGLGFAASAMTDRTGATHMAGIEPDERIATDWSTFGTEADPVLRAARGWLMSQPTCAGEATPVP